MRDSRGIVLTEQTGWFGKNNDVSSNEDFPSKWQTGVETSSQIRFDLSLRNNKVSMASRFSFKLILLKFLF